MSRDNDFSGIVQYNPFKSIVSHPVISCYILWWFVTYKCQESINCFCCILFSLFFCDFLPFTTVMKSPDVVSLSRERVSSAYSFGGHYPTLGKPSALGNCWVIKGKEDAAKQPAHFMAKCGKEKGRCWSHRPLRASASHPRISQQALLASHSLTSKCWHLRT